MYLTGTVWFYMLYRY